MTTPGHAAAGFPARSALTRRFTLGRPRGFTVAPDASRVVFVRSESGTDPVQRLWVIDLATGAERCVADPAAFGDDTPTREERTRRERAREHAAGIVTYATDAAVTLAVVLAGRGAVVVDLVGDAPARPLDLPGPVVDPRLDPTGQRIAWVRDGALWTADVDGSSARRLIGSDEDDVTWGLAEFVAAEEMGRTRGFWWSPDGRRVAVARVDVSQVSRWHVADPVDPARAPSPLRYPAAGTQNADVSLALVDLDGGIQRVEWDRAALPYLATVRWGRRGPLLLALQSRDQRTLQVVAVDEEGATRTLDRTVDRPWVDLVPGTPRWLPGERLLTAVDDTGADARRLVLDGAAFTPPWLQVRTVVDADTDAILLTGSSGDPTEIGAWRMPLDGQAPRRLDPPGGVTTVSGRLAAPVLQRGDLATSGIATTVAPPGGGVVPIGSRAEKPELAPEVEVVELGEHRLRGVLLRPADPDPHRDAAGRLPVLLDPYGGPHAQRVLRRRDAFLIPQWFAEQGFAVLVVDGRGSPGRGPSWERTLAGDLAAVPLADQVAGLEAALAEHPDLDPDRVGIRGWSFGGYLAALAVLRRPDRFHAAVAGAPVTDWRLYDTHYTERYLGRPDTDWDAYRRSSLLEDAHRLARPLLLIHGLADDNVVAAHTLQLSRSLLEAGRSHRVLPLSGVTHMTPQAAVAENLLRLQLEFLREALAR